MPAAKNQTKGATSQPPPDAKTDPKQQKNLKEIEGQVKESEEGERCPLSFEQQKFPKLTNVSSKQNGPPSHVQYLLV
jgi:hypothetical protein